MFSEESKGFDCWNGQQLDFWVPGQCPDCASHLYFWHRGLHMRQMRATNGQKSTVEQRQMWHIVDEWIRDKEKPLRRHQVWSDNASNNVSQGSQTSKEWFAPKLFWEDGTMMQTIRIRCVKMLGQERKSDTTTHLPWKTVPLKPHQKEGDDGKGNLFIVANQGVQGSIRQRPDFSEAKRALRDYARNMLKVPDQGISQSSSTTKKAKCSTTVWWPRGVRLYNSPLNWMEIFSFNKFVFIFAVAAKWMEVEPKLGLLAIFNLERTVKF